MTKNARLVFIAAIVGAVLIVLVAVGWDVLLRRHASFDCGDGPRRTIDIRDFTTRYSGYSLELEASIAEKGKISTKLNPVQLQQLTDAMQSASEFRKYVVAGYDSCAVTKAQYGQFGARLQALDNLAREINELTGKPSLPPDEAARLAGLIGEYGDLALKLGTN
jgi:hypothetical protein